MLLSNEYTLIPHVKILLKYDNNVETSATLKVDDIIACSYRDQDKNSSITGKIGKIGYKLNSSLTAVERSIYLQIDGSKEYAGQVVYVNIDDIVGLKIIKTGSMISNPVCTVENENQSIALIRENDEGKLEYTKNGIDWKGAEGVTLHNIMIRRKKKHPTTNVEVSADPVPSEEHHNDTSSVEGENASSETSNTVTPPSEKPVIVDDGYEEVELTEEYIVDLIDNNPLVLSLKEKVDNIHNTPAVPEEEHHESPAPVDNGLKEIVVANTETLKTLKESVSDYSTIKATVSTLKETIDSLPVEDLKTIKSTVTELQQTINSINNSEDSSSLKSTVSALKEKIDAVPLNDLNSLKEKVETLSQSISAIPVIVSYNKDTEFSGTDSQGYFSNTEEKLEVTLPEFKSFLTTNVAFLLKADTEQFVDGKVTVTIDNGEDENTAVFHKQEIQMNGTNLSKVRFNASFAVSKPTSKIRLHFTTDSTSKVYVLSQSNEDSKTISVFGTGM